MCVFLCLENKFYSLSKITAVYRVGKAGGNVEVSVLQLVMLSLRRLDGDHFRGRGQRVALDVPSI